MFECPCIITLYYIKNQQEATLAVLFISHCKITLHISDAFCVHHQECYPVRLSEVGCHGNRPRTSLMDINHPDPWHAPVAAPTVFSTPDGGRRKHPKYVSNFAVTNKKYCQVASCWFFI